MIARVTGALLMVLGAALAALPAFGWYTAPPVGTPTHASGLSGAGQLWALPVLGALTILSGALLVAAGPEDGARTARRAGALASVAGALALGLSIWAAAAPDVELTVAMPAGRMPVPVEVSLEAAAVATPLVAGAILLLGLAVAGAGRRG